MPTNSNPKTAVIYARFSCSKQREASIDDQLRVCREWCAREGYRVVAEYADRAVSGRTDDREQFQRMIAAAGESSIVLVYMMDRFSRDPYDAPIYKRELAKRGVQLVSALESIPDSPEGIIYEKLLEGLAACESIKTSVRVKRGMEGNALQCKANGVRIWGYTVDAEGRYQIDEETAPLVREAFARRIEGEPAERIARDFAERGYRTSTGKPFTSGAMHLLLHNDKYTGLYHWGDVRVEGGMPAIIDRATFEAACSRRPKKNREKEDWGVFALSGKIVCAQCGRELAGTSGRGKYGVKYEYYRCKKCGTKAVRRDKVEGAICAELRRMLTDRGTCMDIARRVERWANGGAFADVAKAARKSKADAERGLANILAAIEQGIIPPGAKERIAELEEQRDRAELDMRTHKEQAFDADDFCDFLQGGTALTDEDLLAAFVAGAVITGEGDSQEVLVLLNHHANEKEPAKLTLERVRTNQEWWTTLKAGQTKLASYGSKVLVRVPLAA